jgi:peptide/nickel transport system permease protein
MAKNTNKSPSLAKRNWEKLRRNKLAMTGLGLILFLSLSCLIIPTVFGMKYDTVDLTRITLPPSWQYPFGTSKIGEDIFSKLLYGGRVSILVGISGAAGGAIIGIIFGALAGYIGGWFDKIMLRVSEIFMSFPQIILVLILVVYFGQGLMNLIVIFAFTGWMGIFRLVRGKFFSLKEESFVEACRAFGIKKRSIMFKHIFPNTLGPVIVNITLSVAGYILQEAGLSFLGLGVPSGIPTWGNIINAAKSIEVITNFWWLWIPPGLAISLFVLGINFFGDGLRDVLDPTQ